MAATSYHLQALKCWHAPAGPSVGLALEAELSLSNLIVGMSQWLAFDNYHNEAFPRLPALWDTYSGTTPQAVLVDGENRGIKNTPPISDN